MAYVVNLNLTTEGPEIWHLPTFSMTMTDDMNPNLANKGPEILRLPTFIVMVVDDVPLCGESVMLLKCPIRLSHCTGSQ